MRSRLEHRPRLTALAATVSAVFTSGGYHSSAGAQEVEEVVVTGSRIARRDFTAPSPIVTVGAEEFEETSSISVEQVLNRLPQFTPAGSQFSSGEDTPGAFSTPGLSTLNLRGLGTNRNLVLINGRRGQPSSATLAVDVNTVPASAIANVEVITGGASAVYGADAISGVVNFIVKDDFEGIDLDMQTSGTQHGGGEETRLSLLMGSNFSDSGNVMMGIDWVRRNPVWERDRDFFVRGWNDPGTQGSAIFLYDAGYEPLSNPPSQTAVDAVFGSYGYAPGTANPRQVFHFNADGTLFQTTGAINYRGPSGPGHINKIQSDGNLDGDDKDTQASAGLNRYSFFTRAVHRVTDNLSAFAQGNFSSIEVEAVASYAPAQGLLWGAPIPYDNTNFPIPQHLETLLDSRPDPTAPWSLYDVTEYIGSRKTVGDTTVYQIAAGLEGSFPNRDWTWEAYVSQGDTHIVSSLPGHLALENYRAVVGAPNYGQNLHIDVGNGFELECTSGLPVFTSFTPSADCIDSIVTVLRSTTDVEQKIAEFNMQGGIMDIPGGNLRFALGASYRENTLEYHPDSLQDNRSIFNRPVGVIQADDSVGATDVLELYGELLIPVTERFTLELGTRSSDYNTAGRVGTHKALFDYQATDRLRFRGGRQVANRAPNTAELFLGRTLALVGFPGGDPCATNTGVQNRSWGNTPENPRQAEVQALCSAIINHPDSIFDQDPSSWQNIPNFGLEVEIQQGNPNLDPEEAETYTLGAVWSGDRLTASIDYYDVDIQGAISRISVYTVYQKCFNVDGSNPTYTIDDPGGWCRMIQRDENGRRLRVSAPYFNLGGLRTSGVDLQLNWSGDVGTHSMYVNSVLNYLISYEEQASSEDEYIDYTGSLAQGGQFDWRLLTTVGYNLGDVSFGLRWRHLPSALDASAITSPATDIEGVGAYDMFDLFGRWQVNDQVGMRFGIDNLFDTDPEIVGRRPGNNALGSTNRGHYDVLGRRAFVAVKLAF